MSTEKTQSGPLPRVALYQMATGYYLSSALHLVAKLGIADLLKEGPRQPEDLAEATATHALSLKRVLRLLASAGVFEEQENGAFALTAVSECLRADIPWSVRAMVLLFAGDQQHSAWRELEYCVRTGNPVFRKKGLDNPFKDPGRTTEETVRFDEAMADSAAMAATAIAEDYDFSSLRTLVDIGGGNGALLTGLLEAHPHLHGTVFDQPAVAERAKQRIAARGLADRCEARGGDFFKEVPPGADAYILKHVIHDWDDEHAVMILKNCHRAMGENSKLLIVEGVYPSRIDQSVESRGAATNDVTMLVLFGGRHRSEAEFRSLYEAAGFKLTRMVPTQAWASVIEGVRA
jgi:orsellinic acid C2-O-methyltransferase